MNSSGIEGEGELMVSFPHAIAVKNNYDWGAFWTILFHSPMQSRSRTTLWYWLGRFALFHSPMQSRSRTTLRYWLGRFALFHSPMQSRSRRTTSQPPSSPSSFIPPCNRGQEQRGANDCPNPMVSFPHAIAVKNNLNCAAHFTPLFHSPMQSRSRTTE